jgi:hypothetical protein
MLNDQFFQTPKPELFVIAVAPFKQAVARHHQNRKEKIVFVSSFVNLLQQRRQFSIKFFGLNHKLVVPKASAPRQWKSRRN